MAGVKNYNINVIQNGEFYNVHFPYDQSIVALLHNVPGARWEPNGKHWVIPSTHLGWLINEFKGTRFEPFVHIYSAEELGRNESFDSVHDIPDIDISDIDQYVQKGSKLYQHQIDFLKYAKAKGTQGFVLADEPGCISGSAIIRIKEEGKRWTRDTTLRNAYKLYISGVKFKVKTMCNDRFVYMPIKAVLDKGMRDTVELTYQGKTLVCTPDHEIFTEHGWRRADAIQPGDKVYANGEPVCPICGTTEDLISYPYAKFFGYCRCCMYKSRIGPKSKVALERKLDADGYVRLFGFETRWWPLFKYSNGEGIYEHHQVWYEHTGHIVDTSIEAIHHKNHIKTDNRFENLELLSKHEHAMRHVDASTSRLPQNQDVDYYYAHGVKTWCVPHLVTVDSIRPHGNDHVYDIMIDDKEVHNFIANDIVVHNCGKTLSVINYALYRRKQGTCKHCLIIACVNAVKYNWKYDIDKHTNGKEEGYLLGTRLYKRKKGEKYDCTTSDKYEDLVTMKKYGSKGSDGMPFFMIMNIEAIQYHIGKGKNAVYPIADAIVQLINSGEISMIAVDECHKNMSPTSTQGKLILEIKKAVGRNAQWIPMSGTPIVNRPTDLYTPLRLIDAHSIRSFYTWCEHFTVSGNYGSGDVLAYKNIPQLKALLERNMIRRTKAEALDLPAKIDIPIYVENTTYQKHLYASVAAELASAAEEICQKPNPMTALLRLRQVNGSPELVDDTLTVDKDYIKKNAKLAKLLELVDEITSSGEKVIVFSNWVEPLKTLYKFIAVKYKTACFTGTMSEAKREQHKKVFINDPECKVLIGTIDAMGISHTFAVATNAIFYDEPWTMAAKIQAQDRIHRIGTTKNVNYFTLLTANTVDDRVHQVVYDKGAISDYIVDGKLDIKNNPDLFMKLLGNY